MRIFAMGGADLEKLAANELFRLMFLAEKSDLSEPEREILREAHKMFPLTLELAKYRDDLLTAAEHMTDALDALAVAHFVEEKYNAKPKGLHRARPASLGEAMADLFTAATMCGVIGSTNKRVHAIGFVGETIVNVLRYMRERELQKEPALDGEWSKEHPNGTELTDAPWAYRPVYLVTPSGARIKFNETGDTKEVDEIIAAMNARKQR